MTADFWFTLLATIAMFTAIAVFFLPIARGRGVADSSLKTKQIGLPLALFLLGGAFLVIVLIT